MHRTKTRMERIALNRDLVDLDGRCSVSTSCSLGLCSVTFSVGCVKRTWSLFMLGHGPSSSKVTEREIPVVAHVKRPLHIYTAADHVLIGWIKASVAKRSEAQAFVIEATFNILVSGRSDWFVRKILRCPRVTKRASSLTYRICERISHFGG